MNWHTGFAAVGYLVLAFGWLVSLAIVMACLEGDGPESGPEAAVYGSVILLTVFFTWATL